MIFPGGPGGRAGGAVAASAAPRPGRRPSLGGARSGKRARDPVIPAGHRRILVTSRRIGMIPAVGPHSAQFLPIIFPELPDAGVAGVGYFMPNGVSRVPRVS